MGLMDDARHAAKRSAALAEMSDAKRVDHLRAELALMERQRDRHVELADKFEAELAAKDARIAETERCRDNAENALEMANARVGELEHDLLHGHESGPIRSMRARAEQAEKRVGELENKNSYNLQIVREATAHIAELDRLLAYGTDTDAYRRIRARAERAEAERDAIKSVLERVVAKCPKLEPVCIAAVGLTALNPSPAEKDIRC